VFLGVVHNMPEVSSNAGSGGLKMGGTRQLLFYAGEQNEDRSAE
jgi:hypothetical protein